jgi:hypothetical protein
MCTRIVCLCAVVVSVNISNCICRAFVVANHAVPVSRNALESLSIHNSVVTCMGRRCCHLQSQKFIHVSQPVQKKLCEHIQCQCILPKEIVCVDLWYAFANQVSLRTAKVPAWWWDGWNTFRT